MPTVCQALCQALYIYSLIYPSEQPYEVGTVIIAILQMD